MKKILIVEDEPNLRDGIVTAFHDRGWRVVAAADGDEAFRALEGEVFDMVVTDYKMPGANGLDVIKRTKMLNDGTLVLMMTAFHYDKDHIIKRSRMEGLEGVIFKKPVDPDRLRATIIDSVRKS